MRDDLEILVAEARRLGYYINLITSGVGPQRAAHRRAEGSRARPHAAVVPGLDARDERLPVEHADLRAEAAGSAKLIKAHGYPMVLNVVLHRLNIDHVAQILDMALELGAEYLELANTQYYALGLRQPRPAAAQPRAARARRGSHRTRFRSRVGNRMQDLLRRARLPRQPAQEVHERLGRGVPVRRRRRPRAALPRRRACCRGWTFPNVRDRELRVDLVRLAGLQPLPRRRAG